MELFRGFLHDEEEHQTNHTDSNKHHSHHHSHHHHSNHHLYEQSGEFEEFKNKCVEFEDYEQLCNTNCHIQQTPLSNDLYNVAAEVEYLHNDVIESPVPKYSKSEYKTE